MHHPLNTAVAAPFPAPHAARSRVARVQHACAAALVAGSALIPSGLLPGSAESRVHDQVNQLLRVFNRLGRLKASDRELREAERIRNAQVHCHGRQPSELRPRDPFCAPFAPLSVRGRETPRDRTLTPLDGATS